MWWWNLAPHSKYLFTMKPAPHSTVMASIISASLRLPWCVAAIDSAMVKLLVSRMSVLMVPTSVLSCPRVESVGTGAIDRVQEGHPPNKSLP